MIADDQLPRSRHGGGPAEVYARYWRDEALNPTPLPKTGPAFAEKLRLRFEGDAVRAKGPSPKRASRSLVETTVRKPPEAARVSINEVGLSAILDCSSARAMLGSNHYCQPRQ